METSSSAPTAPPAKGVFYAAWSTHVSRSTGKPYWFNKKTGASTFTEPPEIAAARAAGQRIVYDTPAPPPAAAATSAAAPPRPQAPQPAAPQPAPSSSVLSHPFFQQHVVALPQSHPSFAPSSFATAAYAAPPPPAPAFPASSSAASSASSSGWPLTAHPPGLFSPNPVEYRRAVQVICTRIQEEAEAAGLLPAPSSSSGKRPELPPGAHRRFCYAFPPAERSFRMFVEDLADEYGLTCLSTSLSLPEGLLDEDTWGPVYAPVGTAQEEGSDGPSLSLAELTEVGKYCLVYAPGAPLHPVVFAEEQEEARLAAEAEAQRKLEAEALLAAATAAGAGRKGSGSKSGGLAGTKRRADGPPALPAEILQSAVTVVPLAPKRDKRSIAEIQEVINQRKRARLEGGGEGEGGAGVE